MTEQSPRRRQRSLTIRAIAIAVLLVVGAATVDAHVTVWPQDSQPGARERYTVRVPTEGQVGAGFTYEARREGDRIVAITWQQEIKPGEIGEFVFFAVNPMSGEQISWKARQRFADGTSADWVGVEGDRRPASVTRLTAGR